MSHRIELSEDRYKTAMLAVFILTLFVQILDGTIVNVAIPTLADEFGVTDTEIDRAIIGYLVGLAMFIPTSGWLSDRYGSRVVFLASLTVFTMASVLCGAAGSLTQLVVFRFLQGIGAGVMGPWAPPCSIERSHRARERRRPPPSSPWPCWHRRSAPCWVAPFSK